MKLDPPDELFDLCDERGRPLGRTKPRGLVHRDGDWHRAFHCWVIFAAADGTPRIILQQRAFEKLTNPGQWDASVGGHYAAGEGIDGGLREIREELGLDVAAADLCHLGWRRDSADYPNGLHEREVQDIFVLWQPSLPANLHPEPAEVTALAFVPPAVLRQLGRTASASAQVDGGRATEHGLAVGPVTIGPGELIPDRAPYYTRIARVAARLALGPLVVRRRAWW